MSLGARILKYRERRQLTQKELAQRVRVDQAIVSRLEANKQHNVRSDVLCRFADVLGVTTDYLVGRHKEEDGEQTPTALDLVGARD